MQKIIVFAGSKQSGKSSTSNFLHGHIMKKNEQIKYFDISEEGQLLVNSLVEENGQEVEKQGIIDINRKDYDFSQYAMYHIWPFIKSYNFADRLKESTCNIFGIEPALVWGSNEDKETLTNIKMSDFGFAFLPKEIEEMKKEGIYNKPITVRKLLQLFGTKVCRRIQDSCWIDRCIQDIKIEECPIATVSDCRFINEVEAMKKIGAKIIKFKRKIDEDKDESEIALDNYEDVDLIVDNQNMTVHEKNIFVFEYLKSIGWVEGDI